MKKILTGVLLCISLFLLTGCGDKLKGTWSNAEDDDLKVTFKFNGSGKVTYKNQFIDEKEGTYTIDGNKVTIKDISVDEIVYKFTLKDDKLSLKSVNGYPFSYKNLKKQ